jgi:hypothetical protein
MPPVAIPPPAATPAAAPSTTTPTAATAATPAVSTAATATPTRRPLARLIDGERAPIERLPIQLLDRRLRVLVVRKFDECESARLTGHTIGDDADTDDLATAGCARIAQRCLVGVIREISNVNASSHASLSRFELVAA